MKSKSSPASSITRILPAIVWLIAATPIAHLRAQNVYGADMLVANSAVSLDLSAGAAYAQKNKPITIVSPAAGSEIGVLPVSLTVRLDNGVNYTTLRASVNGRDISPLFKRANNALCAITICEMIAIVSAADGIVVGRNELRVEAGQGAGLTRDSRIFTVVVKKPTANAGDDNRVQIGQTVRLDGTRSTLGDPSQTATLTHQWKLVNIPSGSQARLDNPNSPMPAFVADVKGKYVVELVVNDGLNDSEADTVVIGAAPLTSVAPVETAHTDGYNYGLMLNGQFYTAFNQDSEGVEIFVFNRATLAPIDAQVFVNGQNQAADCINSYLNNKPGCVSSVNIDSSMLIIMLTGPKGAGFPVSLIANTLQAFGATSEFAAAGNTAFSFIGVKGLPQRQAYQVANQDYNLVGYFAKDFNQNYTFIQTDYIQFSIQPDSTGESSGTITINGKDYSPPYFCNPNPGGFHLLVMDRAAPASGPIFEQVYCYGNGFFSPSLGTDETTLDARLAGYAADEGKLLLINSLNGIFDHTKEAGFLKVAQQIATLGGTYELLASLGPADTYSFVGSAGPAATLNLPSFVGAEASTQLPGSTGFLRGVLGRGRRGKLYRPIASDLAQVANLDLYQIVGQPSQPFPVPADGNTGQTNAFDWISKELCGSCGSVRDSYQDTNIDIDRYALELALMSPPANPNPPFTTADFNTVRQQLAREFQYVANIRQFNGNLTELWISQEDNINLILNKVGNKVMQALPGIKGDSPAVSIVESIIGSLLSTGSSFPIEHDIPAALGMAAAVFNFATGLANLPDGSSTVDISTTVAQLEQQAADNFAGQLTAQGVLFDLIYSDWGKLQALGSGLSNPDDPNWAWDGDLTTGQILSVLNIAVEKSYYRSLLPIPYAIGRIDGFDSPDLTKYKSFCCLTDLLPFKNYTPEDYLGSLQPDGTSYQIFAIGDRTVPPTDPNRNYNPPPQSIMDRLFNPVDSNGLGLSRYEFYRQWSWPPIACAKSWVNGNNKTGQGCDWPKAK